MWVMMRGAEVADVGEEFHFMICFGCVRMFFSRIRTLRIVASFFLMEPWRSRRICAVLHGDGFILVEIAGGAGSVGWRVPFVGDHIGGHFVGDDAGEHCDWVLH